MHARDSTDDGVLTALLLPPLISIACYYALYHLPEGTLLHPTWLIEKPATLSKAGALTALDSLKRSRRALVQLSSLTSSLLLVHLCASRLYEGYHRFRKTVPESERASVPRREWLRTQLYVVFSFLTSLSTLVSKTVLMRTNLGIWDGPCHSYHIFLLC